MRLSQAALPVVLAVAVMATPAHAAPTRTATTALAESDFPAREIAPCGTVVTPEEAAEYLRRLGERGPVDRAGFSPPYFVPIAAHIIRMSDGSGGLPEERLAQAIEDANLHYLATGVVFYRLGDIDHIDSDEWYVTSTMAEINAMRTTNLVPDAINIYFTEVLDYESGALCGISAFTFSSIQSIAMRNSCTANPAGLGNHSTFSHEIGHYFDLFHTHETAFGAEFVDGSNCLEAGDLLCDTPADPRLGSSNVNTSCVYTGTALDGHGDPYVPDPTQLMSYSLKHCRDNFSMLSFDRIVETLLSARTNLITTPVDAPALGEAGGLPAGAASIALGRPRPNPTSRSTELAFSLVAPALVDVTVYDVRGARVRTLLRDSRPAGVHDVAWDGADASGRGVAPGIYFVRLSARGESAVRKVQLVR